MTRLLIFSRQPKRASGFTLIEVILVLAISSALAIILIGLYSGQQRRARFTDAIETTIARLESIKSEVNSGFSTGTGNQDPARVFFGKSVAFNPGSGSLVIESLTADNSDSLTNIATVESAQAQFSIPWGVIVSTDSSNDAAVVFTRRLTDAQLKAYIFAGASHILNPASYSTTAQTSATISMVDPTGLNARINIDAASGQITSNYED